MCCHRERWLTGSVLSQTHPRFPLISSWFSSKNHPLYRTFPPAYRVRAGQSHSFPRRRAGRFINALPFKLDALVRECKVWPDEAGQAWDREPRKGRQSAASGLLGHLVLHAAPSGDQSAAAARCRAQLGGGKACRRPPRALPRRQGGRL